MLIGAGSGPPIPRHVTPMFQLSCNDPFYIRRLMDLEQAHDRKGTLNPSQELPPVKTGEPKFLQR